MSLENLYTKNPYHYYQVRLCVEDVVKSDIKGVYNKIFLLLTEGATTNDGKKTHLIRDGDGRPISPENSIQTATIKTIAIMKKINEILDQTVDDIMPMEYKKNES